jgi:nucleotide-binding universal stress UspA family protein
VLTSAEVAALVESSFGFAGAPGGTYLLPQSYDDVRRAAEFQLEQAKTIAGRGADLVAELFPKWKVSSEAVTGSAYAVIVDRAKEWDADLVLVGSHGRSLIGRVMFGSVAQNVLSHSPCSVRIGRGQSLGSDKPVGFPLRVFIGVDGSPDSSTAIEAVCSRSWPEGTQVRLATVCDLLLALALIDAGAIPDAAEGRSGDCAPLEKVVRATGTRLRDKPGLEVSTVVLEGDPKHVLLREAERWGADCIVLGAKGHSALERFFVGSVSASVAARAGCTVEVIRRRPSVLSQ